MDILGYADWLELQGPQLMGILSSARTKGREIFSFAYATEWLNSGHAQELDPDLQLYPGQQYLIGNKQNFGIFSRLLT